MARTPDIRSTFVRKLFKVPNPISRSLYERSRQHLFPDETAWLEFLRTSNSQRQVELAKQLLLSLVHRHNLAPPSRLLFNLLRYQELESTEKVGAEYVPQDHFVHLAHLYLLGVFFFCYHEKIHSYCVADINRQRRRFGRLSRDGHTPHDDRYQIRDSLESKNPYEIFASIWSYFVLYHDLAYPLESTSPEGRSPKVPTLLPFRRVRKSIAKDLSLKALSSLVAIRAIIENTSDVSLGDAFLDDAEELFFRSQKFEVLNLRPSGGVALDVDLKGGEEGDEAYEADRQKLLLILREWRSARYLSLVSGGKTIQGLSMILPDAAQCAILEKRDTGKPVVLVFRGGLEPVLFLRRSEVPRSVLTLLRSAEVAAFDTGETPTRSYCWRYFSLDPSTHFDNSLSEIFGSRVKAFVELADYIQDQEEFVAPSMTQEDIIQDLSFAAFYDLSRILGYLEDDDTETMRLEEVFESLSAGMTSVSRKLPLILGRCVSSLLDDEISAGTMQPREIVAGKEHLEAAETIVKHLVSKEQDLVRRLDEHIVPEILRGLHVEQAAKKCSSLLRTLIESSVPGLSDGSEPFREISTKPEATLTDVVEGLGDSTAEVDRYLALLGFSDLKKVVDAYVPKWVKEDSPEARAAFADHGLAATCIAIEANRVYRTCFSRMRADREYKAPREVSILRLALRSSRVADEALLEVESNFLLASVAPAIAIHNLYPEHFENSEYRKYRTSLSRTPFTFLALLADGLQRWDRSRLASQASSSLKALPLAGSSFGLDIHKNYIYVTVRGRRLRLGEEEQGLRSSLGGYLARADSLIRLELIEERS